MREREQLLAENTALRHDLARLQNHALRRVAKVAAHALRQFAEGNGSPGLAAGVAAEVELVLALAARDDAAPTEHAEARS